MNLTVDGNAVSQDKYTIVIGSTIVTLKPEYLTTLAKGEHTLRVNFTDGYAVIRFTIGEAAASSVPVPQTGDGVSVAGFAMLAAAVLACAVALLRRRRG